MSEKKYSIEISGYHNIEQKDNGKTLITLDTYSRIGFQPFGEGRHNWYVHPTQLFTAVYPMYYNRSYISGQYLEKYALFNLHSQSDPKSTFSELDYYVKTERAVPR
jgi:hypothetical protein